jgi:uncharacterized membrane protein YhaH (DUF805 family)
MIDLHLGRSAREPHYLTQLAIITSGLVIFAATTVFRIRDYADKSVDFQVLFKIMCVGLSLIVPIAAVISRRLTLSNPVLLAWLVTLFSLVLSSGR